MAQDLNTHIRQIADRLCCAFGQDVLDTLFARQTWSMIPLGPGSRRKKRHQARPLFFFMLSLGYIRESFALRCGSLIAQSHTHSSTFICSSR